MKKYLFLRSILLASTTVLLTSSCKLEEKAYEKYLGTYAVVETCAGSGTDSYEIVISEDLNGPADVEIYNLFDFEESMVANVQNDQLVIPAQSAFLLDFEGTATINGDLLTINFTVSFDTEGDSCVAEGTRKE